MSTRISKKLCWRVALWMALLVGSSPAAVRAQTGDPDLRDILPYLMLVIDSSGSMEFQVTCTCESLGCENCLPDCSQANVAGVPPASKKNRWATALEALTGTFVDFQCNAIPRTASTGWTDTFDIPYPLPYHQPWNCDSGQICAFDSSLANDNQNSDGILDSYSSQIRFGLMTFDGRATYVGAGDLVPAPEFQTALSNAMDGQWSYGGAKPIHYPNCPTDYMMDTGVRSAIATQGSLISLDSCSGTGGPGTPGCPTWCVQCGSSVTQASINQDIQEALLSARPFGGTPIAASLDDLYTHFKTLPDAFSSCRNRYALLMTDGYPDEDYREVGCNCKYDEDPLSPAYCGGPPNDPDAMKCPYPLPEDAAAKLVTKQTGDSFAMLKRLFVVGMAIDDPKVLARLGAIANSGCHPSDTSCGPSGGDAYYASNLPALVSNLNNILGGLAQPISRSVPAFARSVQAKQYQIATGLRTPDAAGAPWTGLIQRQRFACTTNPVPQPEALALAETNGDYFHEVMNASGGGARTLYTVKPTSGSMESHLFRDDSAAPCGTVNAPDAATPGGECLMTALTDSSIDPPLYGLGSGDTTGKTAITNWMYGINGSARDVQSNGKGRRLGDIFHSSPVVVGPPDDVGNEAHNIFRLRPAVAGRPLTLYVNSNDGILHAFSVEQYTPALGLGGNSYAPGKEMWGFVPPLLINNLGDNLLSHQVLLDATPVVKDVYFNRVKGVEPAGTEYHTVLITGMRGGGNGYIALEVTDPRNPTFLWQFTDQHMGKTFGQPAIGQAIFQIPVGGSNIIKNGAIAILPGGVGELGDSGLLNDCLLGATTAAMNIGGQRTRTFTDTTLAATMDHRTDVRCWRDIGRALYFVDLHTGKLIKKIHADPGISTKRIFPSPIVSGPALFRNEMGALGSRAFVTDADGVIWRIDLSTVDPVPNDPMAGWTARPFHDIFWDKGPALGELTYEIPMLSADESGRLIVIVGTGDTNNFVKPTVENRVVSLTEIIDPAVTDPTSPLRFKAAMNWEKRVKPGGRRLVASELVTGSMALFNGQLFLATFIAITGSDACDLGKGRIHAVHYLNRDTTDANGASPETYGPALLTGIVPPSSPAATVINVTDANAINNLMLMGLGITQRPSCAVSPTVITDYWGQEKSTVSNTSEPPALYLVAQGSGDASLLQKTSGAANAVRLSGVEIQLNKRGSQSRMLSWAGSID